MKLKSLIISFVMAITLLGCKCNSGKHENSDLNKEPEIVKINPLEELKQIDKFLSEIAEKPEHFTIPSNKKRKVKGSKGTIIYVDPNRLETIDGSPLGDKLDIELLEMMDKSSLILNNAQTVSNGEILVTGGAYYLNMTSDGKQLKIKEGKGIEVEFPKLTDNEMSLFIGERDSIGQINWIPTKENFKSKGVSDVENDEEANKSGKADIYECSFYLSSPPKQNYELFWNDNSDLVSIEYMMMKNYTPSSELVDFLAKNTLFYIAFRFDLDTISRRIINVKPHPNNPTELDSKEIIKTLTSLPTCDFKPNEITGGAYSQNHFELQVHLSQDFKNSQRKVAKKEIRKQTKYHQETYKAIALMNFGLINCDRFNSDNRPKTNILFTVNNDSITSAVIFAVLKDMNSLFTKYYFSGYNASSIENIPKGIEIQILALSVKDETPFFYEETFNTETKNQIQLEFVATTKSEIRKKVEKLK